MLRAYIGVVALAGRLTAASELSWDPPSLVPKDANYELVSNSSGIVPCDALREAGLGDRLLFATDAGYEPQIQSWYSENARLRPSCLVLPHNTEEVATALTALVKANNGGGDWHIAVRSGGHGFPGSNNIANGVTIDLTMMNSSTYDPETKLAKIQPGGRWRNVYADLQEAGVVVTGGRDGDVGVGGFLLGGGNSFFSGRVGFGCDTVKNFEVVLANGTVINANSTANSDLWRALKGGSSNYGIVTRYDIEAFPTRDLYYEKRTMRLNYSDSVIDAVVGYANQDQSFADNAFFTFWSHNASIIPETLVSTIYVNTQGDGNATSAFDKVRSLPALSKAATVQNMAEAANGAQLVGGTKNVGTTLTFRNNPQILRQTVELHEDFIKRLSNLIDPKKFTTMVFFQPIPSYMATIAQQKGGNMLGLESLGGNAIMFTAGVAVNSDDKDLAIAKAEVAMLTAQVKEISKSLNGDLDFIYLNYAESIQDPLATYGAENIQHMRDVAAKYDPTEVFQKRIPGGFKISRVA
ncbi:FAD binding domain-containing protein [Daldinia caldariorum]|uniref:FAD binding domain-containing protein n=1 Tax=Daldinia caldariorum TaxID=326644 RepID=UPI00200724FC|nr:FAD binding domain-containing protein [Daldinia caldariorum]KAI1465215.1 FAD binding domain-containing protein [Daldinia caldariorum]